MRGAYVFRVRFRLDAPRIRTDPAEFETVVGLPAPEPRSDDDDPIPWTFFQTALWRGEATDDDHVRRLCSELLSVDAAAASFAELALDADYRTALRAAIAHDPGRFNAANADEVIGQHLGSSIRVVGDDEPLPPE